MISIKLKNKKEPMDCFDSYKGFDTPVWELLNAGKTVEFDGEEIPEVAKEFVIEVKRK